MKKDFLNKFLYYLCTNEKSTIIEDVAEFIDNKAKECSDMKEDFEEFINKNIDKSNDGTKCDI